jgi:hypothetical protein
VEKRRWRRKQIGADGFLYAPDGRQIGPCEIRDVSEGGAMLVFSPADDLPTQFVLSFSRSGRVRRQCEVVWRAAKHIGIRFTGTSPP